MYGPAALTGSGGLVECEHVSGLLMRDTGPLALMNSANEIPYRSSRFNAQLPKAGSSRRRIDRVSSRGSSTATVWHFDAGSGGPSTPSGQTVTNGARSSTTEVGRRETPAKRTGSAATVADPLRRKLREKMEEE